MLKEDRVSDSVNNKIERVVPALMLVAVAVSLAKFHPNPNLPEFLEKPSAA